MRSANDCGIALPRRLAFMLLGLRRRWDNSAWQVAIALALASCVGTLLLARIGFTAQLLLAGLTVLAVAVAAFSSHCQSKLRHAEMRQFLESLCRDDLDQQ